MDIKHVFGAVALAVAGQAMAQGPTIVPGDTAGLLENDFSHYYGQHVLGDSFTDVFSFDISRAGVATAVAFDADVSKYPDAGNLAFSFDYLAITDASFNPIAWDLDGSDGWMVSLAPLSIAGTYRVVVKGEVMGAIDAELPGAYVGSVATAVLAVPEPSTYTLMFAGLAALGCLLRGRRRS